MTNQRQIVPLNESVTKQTGKMMNLMPLDSS